MTLINQRTSLSYSTVVGSSLATSIRLRLTTPLNHLCISNIRYDLCVILLRQNVNYASKIFYNLGPGKQEGGRGGRKGMRDKRFASFPTKAST